MTLVDPTEAFAQLGRIKLSETDLPGVLQTISDLALRTIPGAFDVSVTLVRDTKPHTAAFTGEAALALDESQYQKGHGPCLDAAGTGATHHLPDMGGEERWPDFAGRAMQSGVHSSLSVGMPVHGDTTGALNVYAAARHAFSDGDIELAKAFSGYAAVALANAHLYDTKASLAQQMQAAMDSRAVIEQAKGILMGGRRCSPEEAFRLLTELSQQSNRKLRDVAAALVENAQRK